MLEDDKMDLQETQRLLLAIFSELSRQFHRVPGSAILLRYIKSSYQNDPIRSAVELFLFLFAVHYLLAPKYSTKPNYLTLTEEVGTRFVPFMAFRLNGNQYSGWTGDAF